MKTNTKSQPGQEVNVHYDDGDKHCYLIEVKWSKGDRICFALLHPRGENPEDDSLCQQCIHLAKMWGYGSVSIVFLFSAIVDNVFMLQHEWDPVGSMSNGAIINGAKNSTMIVCAWGQGATLMQRGQEVREIIRQSGIFPMVLGINPDGSPSHPTLDSKTTHPKPWN